ncbi:hypothetical protein ABTX62_04000 [Streptomyces sp. NPDC096046]|uniref:hypothetical protein n=1 Tax=Streptomyces sp. NPDC096046 TaxID=3155542 RepID=UPI00331B0BA0
MNQPSHDAGLFDHCPWLFAGQASEEQLADAVGVADAPGYRPRGVHRPEPAPVTARPV